MGRGLRKPALLLLGLSWLGCQTAAPPPPEPASPSVAALLDEAALRVKEAQIESGVELYQQAALDPAATDAQRAEARYNIALLGLASDTRIHDLPLSLRRLRELRSDYPFHRPREVNALILLTEALIDTRADLARQRDALESVTEAVFGN